MLHNKLFYIIVILLVFCSCENPFQYHPYDVHLSGQRHINASSIDVLEKLPQNDTLCFAVISDTQGWLDETKDMVKSINTLEGIDFVLHLGDITDFGNTKDFMWQRDILNKLYVPYVVVIGNHDVLGTGDETFQKIFGQRDYSFIVKGIKFVCLNTNAIEYEYDVAVPNLDFMLKESKKDVSHFRSTIICMHAPPFNEQFNNNVVRTFEEYVLRFPNPLFCLTGHVHRYEVSNLFNDGMIYYSTDCAKHRNYLVFTIIKDKYSYERIFF